MLTIHGMLHSLNSLIYTGIIMQYATIANYSFLMQIIILFSYLLITYLYHIFINFKIIHY